jgi:hypothetical protein
MDIFNAPSRDVSCVRRERTNTPLQALVTLNDPQFVEAARRLAEHALQAAQAEQPKALDYIFQVALGRTAKPEERKILLKSSQDFLAHYSAKPEDAAALTLAVGPGEGELIIETDAPGARRVVVPMSASVDLPPSVRFTAPADAATLTAGSTTTISAVATLVLDREYDERGTIGDDGSLTLDPAGPAIAEELALPQFRVPAPQNSAQHAAATIVHNRRPDRGLAAGPPVRTPTRQLTRGPQQWQAVEPGAANVDGHDAIAEYPSPPRQFAGIDIEDFGWARQRSRRLLTFWVLTVLVLTGGVAIAGWTLGTNLDGLLGR